MLKKFKITVDGKPYSVSVEDVTDGSAPAVVPTVTPTAIVAMVAPVALAPAAVAPAAKSAGAGDIPSPLGGVVKEVKVTVGQAVNEGDLVVVLEAMKMKTNVFSNITGKVSAVHITPGDAVDSGQALISIG
ncbi:MAG: biotin/lipoyl attachment domain-containing protein [Rhodospirillaceae bacterium]|nr:MAG: biotin/lipoyl attachment domain-containing protein [Rhodospirillaceae bacterium]